jgi:hypothetical protein
MCRPKTAPSNLVYTDVMRSGGLERIVLTLVSAA